MTPASEEHLRKVHSKLRPVVAAFAPDMKRAISWFAEPARQGRVKLHLGLEGHKKKDEDQGRKSAAWEREFSHSAPLSTTCGRN